MKKLLLLMAACCLLLCACRPSGGPTNQKPDVPPAETKSDEISVTLPFHEVEGNHNLFDHEADDTPADEPTEDTHPAILPVQPKPTPVEK